MTRVAGDHARHGAILIFVAVVLLLLLAFIALAVDTGNLYVIRAQLQVAATAAAAAGALDLPDEATAASAAIEFAGRNMPPAIHGEVLSSGDIEFGNWDDETRTFSLGLEPVNAIRVTTRRSSANSNPVGSIFARFFGVAQHDVAATAIAALLPVLPGALGAEGSLTITGNVTIDSYDSSEGPYNPATAGSNGDVAGSDVSVGGSAVVNGDVSGQTVDVGGTITGDVSISRRTLDYPDVDTSEIALNNDNDSLPLIQKGNNLVSPLDADRNFVLTGGIEYNIPPGDYYFNDLKLGGQSSLIVSGPTRIYLTGDLDTSGGDLINSTEDPTNLMIFMTGGTAVINASVDWYGLLYAPNTDVTLTGSADIYGAIIGSTITATGSGDIHFDEALIDVIGEEIDIPPRSVVVG